MVAIISARGGSKRIPKKNIRDFCGRPMLSYSIQTALESGLFEEVMVSTDSDEIAAVAIQYGAAVPFLRSSKNSDDYAGTADVIAEVLSVYAERGKKFESGCCIYPTAPLLSVSTLKKGFDLFTKTNFDVVFPVVKYSYPIQRSLRKERDGKVAMLWPENYPKRSQDLEPVFHDAGQFYWFKSEYILRVGKLFGDNVGGLVIDEMSVQDIDNESDWTMAEFKYHFIKKTEGKGE